MHRVRFANPVIQSFSRAPTRLENLYISLFEDHIKRCSCIPLLDEFLLSSCRQGKALVYVVVLSFYKDMDGTVYSTQNEHGRPVRVELRSYHGDMGNVLWHEYWGQARGRLSESIKRR